MFIPSLAQGKVTKCYLRAATQNPQAARTEVAKARISASLEKKRLRLQSLSGYSRENAISLEATNAFLNEAISEQRLPVKAHFNVMAWADSETELKELQNRVSSSGRQICLHR